MSADASLLLECSDNTACNAIVATLNRFGAQAIAFALANRTRIVPLAPAQRYDDASAALKRLGVDVDGWPAPPAGLFVVEERTVYLRSHSAMTVAHEFGHALDCALGGGVYCSSVDPQLRRLFAAATAYVTPYAATGADEYFAECVRAYVEANDPASFWPRATRARLRRIDPEMYAYVARLFDEVFAAAA
ncbi:MAG TPA: hypothetical protein VJP85_10775 [Candidatus Baltobacteraceae bacterium]|nr:hypothetical protein [Candidatus Baltobacteraceae bacterium]